MCKRKSGTKIQATLWRLETINKMADQPKSRPPEGMEPYDLKTKDDPLGALSEQQQLNLNQFKVIFCVWAIIQVLRIPIDTKLKT